MANPCDALLTHTPMEGLLCDARRILRAAESYTYIWMRTLLDLMSDERGYVRIFAEQEGFAYELSTYVQPPVSDLFERMNGYGSLAAALEAARFQLSAAGQVKRRRRARR